MTASVRVALAALCGTALLASCASPGTTAGTTSSSTTSTTTTTSSAPAAPSATTPDAGAPSAAPSASETTTPGTDPTSTASAGGTSTAGAKKFATAKLPKTAAGYTADKIQSQGEVQMGNYEKPGADGLSLNMVTLQQAAGAETLKSVLDNAKEYGPVTCGEMDTSLGGKKSTPSTSSGPKAIMCVAGLDGGVVTLVTSLPHDEAGKLLNAIYASFA